MTQTLIENLSEFKTKNKNKKNIKSLVPVDLKNDIEVPIKDSRGEFNEQFYKWQFINALIDCKYFKKKQIGTEVYFPKGNTNNYLKVDAVIFDDENWFKTYKKFRKEKDISSLDVLRKKIICAVEFKRQDGKDIEWYYSTQLKPALKESERDYSIGIIYDKEKLFLFKKNKNNVIRYNHSLNSKGDESSTKEMNLHIPDAFRYIPTFRELLVQAGISNIPKDKRSLSDLSEVSGAHSKFINDAMSQILRTMDQNSLADTRGYEILIQAIAMKILDERKSEKKNSELEFFILPDESGFNSINDSSISKFIKRMKGLYAFAKVEYKNFLKGKIELNFSDKRHIKLLAKIVEQFQDFSFIKSYKTDLYQIIFYRFANEFKKDAKGQFITPIPLVSFIVNIVNPRGNETLCDPTVGIGDFLSNAYVSSKPKLKDNNLFGIDNDDQMVMLAQLNMLLNGDGNANIFFYDSHGSINSKISEDNKRLTLKHHLHKNGNWDNWNDDSLIKKFDVILTNPPFGEDRKFEPKTTNEKNIAKLYELWNVASSGKSIDPGLLHLENSVRLLNENGRFGIILSNSLASIDKWQKAREWLMEKIRIVAIFDLPANVFADTGVNTSVIIGYKPSKNELDKIKKDNYEIFSREILEVGYEVKTYKRVKTFVNKYKYSEVDFEVETDENGSPLLIEDFTSTIKDFKYWASKQEKKLKEIFI